MKILLTHGYFLLEDPKEREIMRPYPPLGILFVSAFLEENGYDNTIFDTTFSSTEAQRAYLCEHRPDCLMIYVNLMTRVNVLRLISFVKNEPSLSHTKIILGGPEVRYNAEDLLDHGADFLVIGEGELTALELIEWLAGKSELNLAQIQGLGYVNEKGEKITTEERTKVKSIDELPFPNRKKIDLRAYMETWRTHHGQSTLSVSTMRGCPYTCKWCSRGVYGLSYRRRSPEKVVDEMLFLKETYQPDSLWFVDDVFTVSHKWLEKFVEEVKRRDAGIPFECITRADRMNEEVIDMLKEAGCFRVWIGAESGSQKIIDLMDRRVDVNQVRDMIKLSRQKGIQAGTFIMLGYPGETEEDIEETIHHLKVSNPDYFTITVAYPIKGTDLYQEVESIQLNQLNWADSSDRDIDFQRSYPRKYYHWAVRL
ncbi:MAG: radical SAM protein [Bacteroidia bacterium]